MTLAYEYEESDDESDPEIIFSREWQSLQSGDQLLHTSLPSVMPANVQDTRVSLVFDDPFIKSVASVRTIPFLTVIPSAYVTGKAREVLQAAIDKPGNGNPPRKLWGVRIYNGTCFRLKAIRFLQSVYDTQSFIATLREALKWNEVIQLHDPVFASWFTHTLFEVPGVMQRTFKVTDNGVPLHVSNALRLMEEKYVDDEVVRIIMEVFTDHYGKDGHYLFIPYLTMVLWNDEPQSRQWERSRIESKRVQKAFAIVGMNAHWGALEIDFNSRKLLFGDSLNKTIPDDAKRGVWKWLRHVGVDTTKWDRSVGKLFVPRQPPQSGSCAINAANAIERSVNSTVELWRHDRSAYHRVRFLKLITGYSKVSTSDADALVALLKSVMFNLTEIDAVSQLADSMPSSISTNPSTAHQDHNSDKPIHHSDSDASQFGDLIPSSVLTEPSTAPQDNKDDKLMHHPNPDAFELGDLTPKSTSTDPSIASLDKDVDRSIQHPDPGKLSGDDDAPPLVIKLEPVIQVGEEDAIDYFGQDSILDRGVVGNDLESHTKLMEHSKVLDIDNRTAEGCRGPNVEQERHTTNNNGVQDIMNEKEGDEVLAYGSGEEHWSEYSSEEWRGEVNEAESLDGTDDNLQFNTDDDGVFEDQDNHASSEDEDMDSRLSGDDDDMEESYTNHHPDPEYSDLSSDDERRKFVDAAKDDGRPCVFDVFETVDNAETAIRAWAHRHGFEVKRLHYDSYTPRGMSVLHLIIIRVSEPIT
ncbi:hypothetical protein BGZ99_007862 [Dissophora globulifera]|uniref:Uncharacterized protein n=1 Tax=Dissophora globulifera TaxID=979702 RepID=A0A9P6RCM1_9FUNG|nr:hypothetical protein BGZ99_007862 [Dissophora globulifera]